MLRNTRKGFTLIELLIVVVIIGILAAIAIPKFANTKDKAKVSGMKTDLRNLVSAQEGHFSDYQTYAATATNAARSATNVTFNPSAGHERRALADERLGDADGRQHDRDRGPVVGRLVGDDHAHGPGRERELLRVRRQLDARGRGAGRHARGLGLLPVVGRTRA